MKDNDDIQRLLNKAKVGLMQKLDSAFFTTILFSLKFQWRDDIRTAGVDGTNLFFNKEFFLSMSPEERIGVLVHEACHVAYMHIGRQGSRIKWLFNEAADHVINLMLIDRGFKIPSFGLMDPRFRGMGTEQVYEILLAEYNAMPKPPQGGPGDPDSNGQGGMQMPGQRDNKMADLMDNPDVAPDKLAAQIDDMIIRATVYSKMQNDKPGTIPGEIALYLDKLLNPKLPWQSILRKYLQDQAKTDYTWKRANRRFAPQHHLPSLLTEGAMVDFEAWVDISGSVSDSDFLRFISELGGIMRMMQPKKITLGQFDTSIRSIDVVRNLAELKSVEFTGRGGTHIREVLDRLEKVRPAMAMIFTDGDFHMDRTTCKANIIWMIHDNPNWKAPFGKVIHYSMAEGR